MPFRELSNTLLDLVEAIDAPPDSGLVIDHAEIDVPLEVNGVVRSGRLVFYAAPPHTRWRSGVLPIVHTARLLIGPVSAAERWPGER